MLNKKMQSSKRLDRAMLPHVSPADRIWDVVKQSKRKNALQVDNKITIPLTGKQRVTSFDLN